MLSGSRGFTLIEMAVLLAILAVLVAVAVPLVSNFNTLSVNEAATRIQADLRYAQEVAITSNLHTRVAFNTGSNSYTITQDEGTGTYANITDPLTKASSYSVSFATLAEYKNVSITAVSFDGQSTLEFDSLGRPYSVNAGTATLLTANGSVTLNGATTITVVKNTGAVSF